MLVFHILLQVLSKCFFFSIFPFFLRRKRKNIFYIRFNFEHSVYDMHNIQFWDAKHTIVSYISIKYNSSIFQINYSVYFNHIISVINIQHYLYDDVDIFVKIPLFQCSLFPLMIDHLPFESDTAIVCTTFSITFSITKKCTSGFLSIS